MYGNLAFLVCILASSLREGNRKLTLSHGESFMAFSRKLDIYDFPKQ
jgi:hypothetical protein